MPNALVIGAGPAGTVAGLILARAGWHVTLVEQQAFPRDKVCGECLSNLGTQVLRRLGAADRVLDGATRLDRTLLHAPDGRCVAMVLPAACRGISRSRLDQRLLEAAQEGGVAVRQPARAEAIERSAGWGAAVQVRDLTTNFLDLLSADYVLLADGKSALLAGKPPATGDLGVKAHFAAVDGPRDAVELFGLDGHYAGLNPVEDGLWNFAMSIPAERVRQMGDFDTLLHRMMQANRGLRQRLIKATRIGSWLASPLPRFGIDESRWPDGIIPLGNAAAALEPIGGEGMGLAMRSSELAATALIESERCGRRLRFADIAGDFRKLWRVRRIACRAGAMAMSREAVAAGALELLGESEKLHALTLSLIGK